MKLLKILKNSKNVLGQNARNLKYIKPAGGAKERAIADNKILTKKLLLANNIPTPKLLGVIKNQTELDKFNWDKLPKSFVIKPVHGVQGGGIEIFYNRDTEGNWIRADRSKMSLEQIKDYARDIIEGKYAIHNQPDQVFFEERVKTHNDLRNYTYKGTPDIRVVVYNKIPVLAYVRFPTAESKGKANMILGAVGTGIDLASGITTTSTYGKGNNYRGEDIEFVPGTQLRYQGLRIPYWNKILNSAIKLQIASGLKFVAIDFLIDNERGPMIVEINARPGLSIQLVNRTGLAWRLQKVKGIKVKTIEQGIRLGKDLFGGKIEEEIERVSGKEVISNLMPVKLMFEGKKINSLALIDTSRRTTVIDSKLAIELGIIDEPVNDEDYYLENIKIKLGSQVLESECRIEKFSAKNVRVAIGRKDLGNFIIDVKKVESTDESSLREQLIAERPKTTISKMDTVLSEILRKISLASAIKPINLDSEQQKFFANDGEYNPTFEYKPLRFNPDLILERLNNLNPSEGGISSLYKKRIEEIKRFIYLMEDIGLDNESFSSRSSGIFGQPKPEILAIANRILEESIGIKTEKIELLENSEIIKRLQKALKDNKLDPNLEIREGSGFSVKRWSGTLVVPTTLSRSEEELESLINHEIKTHLVRAKRGQENKYKIFALGTSGYISTEEGLATLMAYIDRSNPHLRTSAMLYVLIDTALKSDFKTTFKVALKHCKTARQAWYYTTRVKRGLYDTSQKGAFTKDMYFEWIMEVGKKLIDKPELIDYAFNGKASLEELAEFTEPVKSNIEIEKIRKLLKYNHMI